MFNIFMVETQKKTKLAAHRDQSLNTNSAGLFSTMSCSWFIAVIDLLVEYTTEHKCAQDMALHTTKLALHTTGPICFDSLTCLQIALLTFEYLLQLLVVPNVCLTNNENNALTTIVPVTHLNARNPLVLVPNRRVHAPPFCLQLARLCAAQCSVVCSSARLCGGSLVSGSAGLKFASIA